MRRPSQKRRKANRRSAGFCPRCRVNRLYLGGLCPPCRKQVDALKAAAPRRPPLEVRLEEKRQRQQAARDHMFAVEAIRRPLEAHEQRMQELVARLDLWWQQHRQGAPLQPQGDTGAAR